MFTYDTVLGVPLNVVDGRMGGLWGGLPRRAIAVANIGRTVITVGWNANNDINNDNNDKSEI